LYWRSEVIDGNFSAEHLEMRRPEDDVALTSGDGYMTGIQRYEEHLKRARESDQVNICTIDSICISLMFLVISSNQHVQTIRQQIGHMLLKTI
jgi:hypothetical protein